MINRNIIVIGASTGGFEALQSLVAGLSPSLPASIFVVWHMSPEVRGILPFVLNKCETLPAANAYDGERFQQGRIYVAPPDRHMIIEEAQLRISRGPKENRFRPAIDPLFRSAAFTYGKQVIGIILSGALDDGTAGLWMIKDFGGTAIVQHPRDAPVPSMPESALREVAIDYSIPVAEMPALLHQLCTTPVSDTQQHKLMSLQEKNNIEQEIRVAGGDQSAGEQIRQFGEPTSYTCPECHGVLFALRDGKLTRYRCHTGHAFSSDSLLSAVTETVDDSLWNLIRGMEECILLLNSTGDHHAAGNNPQLAAKYFQKAAEIVTRVKLLKEMAASGEQLSRDQIDETQA